MATGGGAYLLDGIPFSVVQGLSGLFTGYFGSYYLGLAWGQCWGWALIAYRVLLHGFWGQTLGKKICKVRVVALEGQPLSMKQALLREIVPIALGLAYLLFLVLNLDAYERMVMGGEPNSRLATANTVYFVAVSLWWVAQIVTMRLNDKRRAIHDYIAGSMVLRLGVQVAEPGERHKGVAGSWLKGLERLGRPGMAGLRAGAAAITSLISPTLLLLSSGGEICPGYQVDVAGYYLKLVPLALVAAVLGAVLGAAIGWPGRLLAKGERSDWRLGCLIAAIAIGGVGLALISCFLAVFPGC